MKDLIDGLSDRLTRWIGSTTSLLLHTLVFIFALLAHPLFGWELNSVLLVLTTAVSLEAIYLAIFIQRAVNTQGERLEDVEESIDDVEEALEDVEEALDEVEEGLDEVEEGLDDVEKSFKKRHPTSDASEEKLLTEIKTLLGAVEELLQNKREDKE